ncbi:MAG: twin-arginine translocase TatA/TatE family subunit [Halobacteriaceae archaeon]
MTLTSMPLFMPGGIGGPELVIVLLIAVLLFGANKIPKLARATGQAMGEFQRGREELEEEIEDLQNPTRSSSDSESDAESSSSSSSSGSKESSSSSSSE